MTNITAASNLQEQYVLIPIPTTPEQNSPGFQLMQFMSPKEHIENCIQIELQKQLEQHHSEEERYVAQMLAENPVTTGARRPKSKKTEVSDSSSEANLTLPKHIEMCRKSRLNGKIKKAKLSYSHKYVSSKLKHNEEKLQNLRRLVSQAEQHLLNCGIQPTMLMNMRNHFGFRNAAHESRT